MEISQIISIVSNEGHLCASGLHMGSLANQISKKIGEKYTI